MYTCTDRAKVDTIFVAKTPRAVVEVMREAYPDATLDTQGRYHAPYDGYRCPFTDAQFRAGEFLPGPEGEAGARLYKATALCDGELMDWVGSEAQIDAVRDELKRQQNAIDAAISNHLGEVKKKLTTRVTVAVARVSSGYYGRQFFNILKDEAGNILTYKGTVDLGLEGDIVELSCTVKAHTVRDGVKQTVIERPKVLAN